MGHLSWEEEMDGMLTTGEILARPASDRLLIAEPRADEVGRRLRSQMVFIP